MKGFRGKSGGEINRRLHGSHQGFGMRGGKAGGVSLAGSAALGNSFKYNGVDAPAAFRFDSNDFADPWVGAAGIAELDSLAGTPAVSVVADPFGGSAVQFTGNGASAGECYQSSDNSDGDVSTEDFLIETILRIPSSASSGIISSSQRHASIDHGWSLRHNAANVFLGIRDTSPAAASILIPRATLVDGEWNLITFAFDKSGNGYAWSGIGGLIGPVVVSGVGDLSTLLPLTIGDYSGISHAKGEFDLAHLAMYKPTNLDLSSSANLIASCEARYALLGGTPGSTLG